MDAGRSIDPRMPAAIRVSSLGKTFDLPHSRYVSTRERVLHPFSFRTNEVLEALHGVSFEVAQGETFGIIGHNGSGKSTLLRCLAGIYIASVGEIEITGRVAPFIEIGVGFNPELAARENAIQSAVLLGLTRREAGERLGEIIAFAELERFADQKLKNYSSGMAARLAFSVAAHVDADVLLCDEVLAVGDADFQAKCHDHFAHMRDEGKTIVLVTHDMGALERSCSRALLLDSGRVVDVGPTKEIVAHYGRLAHQTHEDPAPHADVPREPVQSVGPTGPTRPPRPTSTTAAEHSAGRLRRRRLAAVTAMLAITDVRLKYFDAVLSYAWAILRPALLFGVLLVVFDGIAGFGDDIAQYPEQLVIGVVLWTFFAQATNASLPSLVRRADLLRKLPVPRLAVPYSSVLASAFDLALNLVVMFVFLIALGVNPRLSWLELGPLLAALGLLTIGMSLILSAIFVRYRDLDQLWSVGSQALFFLTPIFYVITTVPAPYERVVLLANPVAAIITQTRNALLGDAAPSAAAVAGGEAYLLVPLAITVALVTLGVAAFRRISPRAAEYV